MKIDYGKIEYRMSVGTAEQLAEKKSDLPEIAFSGRSNVGKSTLLNKICGRKNLARVSGEPGKTTTINFFSDGNVNFCDLPGYGYAKRSDAEKLRWADLMELYFNSGRDIRLVVQLVDSRRTPTDDDFDMMNFMTDAGCEFIVVMTKFDKLNKSEQANRLSEIKVEMKEYPNVKIIPFSSTKNIGVDDVKRTIEKFLGE